LKEWKIEKLKWVSKSMLEKMNVPIRSNLTSRE
jgi:hypothetical protein